MELSKRAFRWLVDRSLLDLRSGALQGDVVALNAAASANLQNGNIILSIFNRFKGGAMTDMPSAAPGRAAAATNWQSIFTVAGSIGVTLDADMRALVLGGDPQVLQAPLQSAYLTSYQPAPLPPSPNSHLCSLRSCVSLSTTC
jgi:hypothetical protein